MNGWLYSIILAALICVAIYLLYHMGFGVLKRIAAVVFVFRPGRDADRADVNSCTGWVKHVGRFREGGTYELTLEAQLSKGTAEVTLLDRKKQELLKLTPASPTGKIELDPQNRYYLRWDFKSATGKCRLYW